MSSMPIIRRNIHSRKLRMINLSYNSKSSLSSSEKNNRAKQTHAQKMKKNNKSYFRLSIDALSHTCWMNRARTMNITVVTRKIQIYSNMNFHFMFLNISFRVTFSHCSLFFICLIRVFRWAKKYRKIVTLNISNMNSFHIQKIVQNLQSRPSLNVTNVCKKNCNKSQITKILQSKSNRCLEVIEQTLDRKVESFFIIIKKRHKKVILIFLFFYFCRLFCWFLTIWTVGILL